MDVKRKPRSASDTDSDTDAAAQAQVQDEAAQALGKRAADEAILTGNGSKKRKHKSKEDKQPNPKPNERDEAPEDAQAAISPPREGVEAFAAPVDAAQPPVDAPLPEAMPQEMVITTETAVDAAALGVEGVESVPMAVPVPQILPVKPRKGRRVRKTNLEKMEILAFVDQGGSQGAAAEKFGVSRTAVTKMVKERAAISAQALVESSTSSRKVLQYQHKLSIIEDMLYKWQMQVELDAPALKITGDLLQSKAMEYRNKILADYSSELSDEIVLSLTDFKASNGWLHRYMQRRSIRSFPKQHDTTTVPPERSSNDERIQRIRELLLTVTPSCIWNLDQLVLRYRTTSARLDSVVNMDARSLERISIAMAVSATGEKLRLQVVGKDPNPKSLKDVDTLSSYGIQYRDHCRASHDSHAIVDFIQAMNLEAKSRKEVWYLVLDSSTAHVAAAHALNPSGSRQGGFRFDSMVLLFLPPGPMHEAQPLHHDIFKSFKLQFRRDMLQKLICEYERWTSSTKNILLSQSNGVGVAGDEALVNETSTFDVHAHTHMRNALGWLQKAWETVPASQIRQAWSACLYVAPVVPGEEEAASTLLREGSSELKMYDELFSALAKVPLLQKALGLESSQPEQLMVDLLEFDKSEANGSDELAKDDEIVMESLSAQGLLRDTQRVLVLENIVKDEVSPIPTVSEANMAVARLLHFMSQNNDNILTLAERRTGRANLLILQRLLLKARERERERESATDFTV